MIKSIPLVVDQWSHNVNHHLRLWMIPENLLVDLKTLRFGTTDNLQLENLARMHTDNLQLDNLPQECKLARVQLPPYYNLKVVVLSREFRQEEYSVGVGWKTSPDTFSCWDNAED